jgi:transposase
MDIHDGHTQVAVTSTDGAILDERRIFDADLEEFAREFAGSSVAIEATGFYRHVYETLDEHMDVTLVNPKKTRVIAEASIKTDKVDARMLAHLLRADLLAESYVPPRNLREQRDLVRTRKTLVEDRTRMKARVRAVLKRTGNQYRSELFGPTGREFLKNLSWAATDRAIVESYLDVIDAYDDQISSLDTEIDQIARESPEATLLKTIPGVGAFSAVLLTAEIGDIDRFSSHEKLVSYAGLNPTVRQSSDSETRGGISKEGSAAMRWVLTQCANSAIACGNEYLVEFYERVKRRKNHQIAIVATARKLLVSIYYMLSRQEEYNPPAG